MFNKQITQIVKEIVKNYIRPGDFALDMTAGNGHDTCFLAECVGPNGHVYAFDIQKAALEQTRVNLEKENLISNVTLINDDHSKLNTYELPQMAVIMMNLGYLPGGDKGIITKAETTVLALKQALDILKPGGVFSIVSYYGHEGGQAEKEALENALKELIPKKYEVITMFYPNRGNSAPILHFIYNRNKL